MASWKGCSLRAMDYLYEHEINSNKGSLKTRQKQSVGIEGERKGEMWEDAKKKK